jgi:predicted metal-dependent phosphoesterase TrpH
MLIDLHMHTKRHSWDSLLDVHDLIDRAKQTGLDGICLTEHDIFWDLDEVRDLGKQHDFLVIPGVEINTDDGHFLCFGLQAYVFGMHRTKDLAAHVIAAGGVMVAAHPYRRNLPPPSTGDTEYARALDATSKRHAWTFCAAMERVNGRGNERENTFSSQIIDTIAIPAVAGSDSHQWTDIGRCATDFDARIESAADLIAALKSGACRPVTLR